MELRWKHSYSAQLCSQGVPNQGIHQDRWNRGSLAPIGGAESWKLQEFPRGKCDSNWLRTLDVNWNNFFFMILGPLVGYRPFRLQWSKSVTSPNLWGGRDPGREVDWTLWKFQILLLMKPIVFIVWIIHNYDEWLMIESCWKSFKISCDSLESEFRIGAPTTRSLHRHHCLSLPRCVLCWTVAGRPDDEICAKGKHALLQVLLAICSVTLCQKSDRWLDIFWWDAGLSRPYYCHLGSKQFFSPCPLI